VTLKSIEKLNNADIPCNILTKGILPIELSNLSKKNEYGITLVSLDENYRIKTEPNASPYQDRIDALKKLHDAGCKTWVSIEPYPTPNIIEQNIFEILNAISFVDKIIFGRTHYNKMISEYKNHKQFYNNEAKKVISFCQDNNIAYHIKTGTLTNE